MTMEVDEELKKRLRKPRIIYTPSPTQSRKMKTTKSTITITSSPPSLTTQPKHLSFSTDSTESSTIPTVNSNLPGLIDGLGITNIESDKLQAFIKNILAQEFARITETLVKENTELKARITDLEIQLAAQNSNNKKRLDDQHAKIVEVATSENYSKEQKQTVVSLQKHVYRLEQYGRRNNVEFAGIPESFSDDELEDKLIAVLEEIDVPVAKEDIEACHRLGRKISANGSPRRVIIRFVNRKFCFNIHKNKHKFKDLTEAQRKKLRLGKNSIYANYSLCKAYGGLWFSCKKLHANGIIDGFWVSNGAIKIMKKGETVPTLIEHQSDLEAVAPDLDFDGLTFPQAGTPQAASNRSSNNKKKNKRRK